MWLYRLLGMLLLLCTGCQSGTKTPQGDTGFCVNSVETWNKTNTDNGPVVLALFDVHRKLKNPNVSTICADLDIGALEAVEGLSWTVQRLNDRKYIPGSKLGFVAIDTCGSRERVQASLYQWIQTRNCRTATVGLLATTEDESTREARKWFRALDLPYISVSRHTQSDHSEMTIPSAVNQMIQGVTSSLSHFNQTYITLVSDHSTIKLAAGVRRDLVKTQICVTTHVTFAQLSRSTITGNYMATLRSILGLYPQSNTTLLLLNAEHFHALFSGTAEGDFSHLFVVVSDYNKGITTLENLSSGNPNFSLLILRHVFGDLLGFQYYLRDSVINRENDNPFLEQYLNDVDECYKEGEDLSTVSTRLCEPETELGNQYYQNDLFQSLSLAVVAIGELMTRTHNAKCIEDNKRCSAPGNITTKDVLVHKKWLSDRMKSRGIRQELGINLWNESIILTLATFSMSQLRTADIAQFKAGERQVISTVSGASQFLPRSQCLESCQRCQHATVLSRHLETIEVDTDADVLIVGIFPAYSFSRNPDGSTCHTNPTYHESLLEVFRKTVYAAAKKKILGGFRIGVLISRPSYSSPAERSQFQNKKNEDIGVFYDKILGFVSFDPSLCHQHAAKNSSLQNITLDKPLVEVSPKDVFFRHSSNKFHDHCAARPLINKHLQKSLLSLFLEQNWKYAYAIYSDDIISTESMQRMETIFRQSQICIGQKTKVNRQPMSAAQSEPRNNHSEAMRMLSSSQRAILPVVLFLDMHDVRSILTIIGNGNSTTSFLWVIPNMPRRTALFEKLLRPDDYIIGVSKLNLWKDERLTNFSPEPLPMAPCRFSTYSTYTYRPEEYFANLYYTVKALATATEEIYKRACRIKDLACLMSELSKDLTSGIADQMRNGRRSDLNRPTVHNDGSLGIPYVVELYHRLQTSIGRTTLGEITSSGQFRKTSSIVLHKSECPGWCPRCMSCQNGSDLLSAEPMAIVPGELYLVALLPLHEKGETALQCGSIKSINNEQQTTEAFLHLLDTLPRRLDHIRAARHIRFGGIVLDTCSNKNVATRVLFNSETCRLSVNNEQNMDIINPLRILAYLAPEAEDGIEDQMTSIEKSLLTFSVKNKFRIASTFNKKTESRNPHVINMGPFPMEQATPIVDVLTYFNWTHVAVVRSDNELDRMATNAFMQIAHEKGMCIQGFYVISSYMTVDYIGRILRQHSIKPRAVVLFTSLVDTVKLFHAAKRESRRFVWILLGQNQAAAYVMDIRSHAYGAVSITRPAIRHREFLNYYQTLKPRNNPRNPWFNEFWESRFQCSLGNVRTSRHWRQCTGLESLPGVPRHPTVTFLENAVNVIIIAFDKVHKQLCPEGKHLCKAMADTTNFFPLFNRVLKEEAKTQMVRQSHKEFQIFRFQRTNLGKDQFVQIGKHTDGAFIPDSYFSLYMYDSLWTEYQASTNIDCLNLSNSLGDQESRDFEDMDELGTRWQYSELSSFIGETWVTVVLTIASIGILIALVVMGYVIYKKVTKLLAEGSAMAILLLLGIMMLYGSTFTFALTPNNLTCGLRVLVVGISYAFSFGVILVKAMTLRHVKYLGLGGDISFANQLLTLFFIIGIQIALTIQWWVLRNPLSIATTAGDGKGDIVSIQCKYTKLEFLASMIYPAVLLLITACFTISVRKVKHNCNEVVFLLVACWSCIIIVIIWIVLLLFTPPEFQDPVICVASLVCASILLVCIFLPRVHVLATMKYNLSSMSLDPLHRSYRSAVTGSDFVFCDTYNVHPKPAKRVNFCETPPSDDHTERKTRSYKF